MRQEASGIFLGGVELGNQLLVSSETRDPALDLAPGSMFLQLREEARVDWPKVSRQVGRSTFACARHHQLTF
jgi:hypothetical protein